MPKLLPVVAFLAASLATPIAAVSGDVLLSGTATATDGDTIAIGPVRVRLHGVDAPESTQQCQTAGGALWPCGQIAHAHLAGLAEGQNVVCKVLDRDRFGRLVATCQADGADLGGAMIEAGFAWAFTRYSQDYVAAETAARAAKIGVWQGPATAPWDYRKGER